MSIDEVRDPHTDPRPHQLCRTSLIRSIRAKREFFSFRGVRGHGVRQSVGGDASGIPDTSYRRSCT